MPRPRKCRRVCCLPQTNIFGALNSSCRQCDILVMTVEEYETIRLMDYEGLTQEDCAIRMGVARTTVQRIYNDARKKLAQLLVLNKVLKIEGGDYQLCDERENFCCKNCHKHYL